MGAYDEALAILKGLPPEEQEKLVAAIEQQIEKKEEEEKNTLKGMLKELARDIHYDTKVCRETDFDDWDDRHTAWELGYRAALKDVENLLPPVEARFRIEERTVEGTRIWVDVYIHDELFEPASQVYTSSRTLTKEAARMFCEGNISVDDLRHMVLQKRPQVGNRAYDI